MSTPTVIPEFLYWYKAKCIDVTDGDTITIVTDLGFRMSFEQRVRLYGINTYEMNDPDPIKRDLALKAKIFVGLAIRDRNIVIRTEKDKQDKYGRWLARIRYQDESGVWHYLNDELIEQGLAVPFMV